MAKQHTTRFLQIVDDARTRVQECTIADLKAKLDSVDSIHVVDVREESEFAAGHIPGSTHLGKGVIERDIEKTFPDETTTMYLYCGGGYRSALAADNLQKMGYKNVISVDGGFRGWKEAGYEIES